MAIAVSTPYHSFRENDNSAQKAYASFEFAVEVYEKAQKQAKKLKINNEAPDQKTKEE